MSRFPLRIGDEPQPAGDIRPHQLGHGRSSGLEASVCGPRRGVIRAGIGEVDAAESNVAGSE